MNETSIITGKILTSGRGSGSSVPKKLYIKIFLGEFTHKAPRPKKAKVFSGELLIKYSSREWPEKKNGPLVGDVGLLEGVSLLLANLNLKNVSEISYASIQYPIKEMVTLKVGPKLAEEIVQQGWTQLNQPVML